MTNQHGFNTNTWWLVLLFSQGSNTIELDWLNQIPTETSPFTVPENGVYFLDSYIDRNYGGAAGFDVTIDGITHTWWAGTYACSYPVKKGTIIHHVHGTFVPYKK